MQGENTLSVHVFFTDQCHFFISTLYILPLQLNAQKGHEQIEIGPKPPEMSSHNIFFYVLATEKVPAN